MHTYIHKIAHRRARTTCIIHTPYGNGWCARYKKKQRFSYIYSIGSYAVCIIYNLAASRVFTHVWNNGERAASARGTDKIAVMASRARLFIRDGGKCFPLWCRLYIYIYIQREPMRLKSWKWLARGRRGENDSTPFVRRSERFNFNFQPQRSFCISSLWAASILHVLYDFYCSFIHTKRFVSKADV